MILKKYHKKWYLNIKNNQKNKFMSKFQLPTEIIDLPSKGVLYESGSALAEGSVEMKYMTAKEEDILTNQNLIAKGIALDELLKALLITKVNLDELLVGDKNALLVATRILGYGKEYTFKVLDEDNQLVDRTVDLSKLKDKELITDTQIEAGKNEFAFTLPSAKVDITFKLLNYKDDKNIDKELKELKKLFPTKPSPELSLRLKYIITSVDGARGSKDIRDYVDNYLLARDAKTLREEYRRITPDLDTVYKEDGQEAVKIPINLNFFWPK